MYKYPKSFQLLVDKFKELPGVGEKTAQRYAFHLLNSYKSTDFEDLITTIENFKISMHKCPICNNITDKDICSICLDSSRDKTTLMVVEQTKDLISIESLSLYKGIYHVLGGVVSLTRGISIHDLDITNLINRINSEDIKEVILATNATLEGETTARYIKELLTDSDIKITRIGYGLPVGSDLTYVDELTLIKSLEGRKIYE